MTSPSTSTPDELRDPRLRVFMNLQAFGDMPQQAGGLEAIRDAGYDGVQFGWQIDRAQLDEARRLGLGVCGSGRVNTPAEAAPLAKEAREAGLECLTLHVGWGTENDDEAAALIASVLDASAKVFDSAVSGDAPRHDLSGPMAHGAVP